jgi:hypothetical protein
MSVLSNFDIIAICDWLEIPLVGVFHKDKLPKQKKEKEKEMHDSRIGWNNHEPNNSMSFNCFDVGRTGTVGRREHDESSVNT